MTANRPLVVVGAGGFGRETAELVAAINAATPTWDLIGFVDDDPRLHGTTVGGVRVIGPVEGVTESDAAVVVCVGRPGNSAARPAIVDRLALDPGRYATLIHPTCSIAGSTTIGPGSVVHAHGVTTCDVVVGAHVAVMPMVVMTHDDVVGDHVTFGAGARLAGGVRVGAGAYIGSGACVREGCSIGAGALVGMGAVVTSDVPAGAVWAGVPAAPINAPGGPS